MVFFQTRKLSRSVRIRRPSPGWRSLRQRTVFSHFL